MLTVKDVAQRLRCSDQTVWQRIKAGELAAVKDKRRWLVESAELTRYIEERKK